MRTTSSTTTARGKRSRDQGDSAVDTSSDSAVDTSTSQLHIDTLAHLASAYAAVDGYALAREEKAAQRAAGIFRDGIQYGEVSTASFARCLEWVQPIAGEIFFDLGSGTGKAVLTAAALHRVLPALASGTASPVSAWRSSVLVLSPHRLAPEGAGPSTGQLAE